MTPDPFSLRDKVALVTGASSGLGRVTALALAAAGARVMAVARREEPLQSLTSAIAAQGGEAAYLIADVGAAAAPAEVVAGTVARFGRLDFLINNAGIARSGAAATFSLDDWQHVLHVNLTAPFRFAQEAARVMMTQGGGKIVNVASMFGLRGEPNLAAYCASKGGLIQLTRVLAIEWAGHNIQVNALAPGYFETEMTEAATQNAAVTEAILRRTPARRFGKAEEIGPIMVFLCSSGADYMTGEVITIDGGRLAR
jgi:2-dehydro-3-deoxy-D-gluconate 5-dehydrogenase